MSEYSCQSKTQSILSLTSHHWEESRHLVDYFRFSEAEYYILRSTALTHLLSDMEGFLIWLGPREGKGSVTGPDHDKSSSAAWAICRVDRGIFSGKRCHGECMASSTEIATWIPGFQLKATSFAAKNYPSFIEQLLIGYWAQLCWSI